MLADTVGLATPDLVAGVVDAVVRSIDSSVEIGVHLHARRQDAAAKIRAAWQAGCRRFDSAIGGMGGCPFAQDALVGNIATELAVAALTQLGAALTPLAPLDGLVAASEQMERRFGAAVQ